GLAARPHAIGKGGAEPVDAAEAEVRAERVALRAEVVPPEVEADARHEAEVEEAGRDDPRLAVVPGEEVDEEDGPLLALGGGHEPADRLPQHVLEDDVHG